MSRRILLACLGTAGDVLPAVQLAVRLRDEGCDVAVGTEPVHAALTRARGLAWSAIGETTAADLKRAVTDALRSDLDPARRGAALVRRLVVPRRAAICERVVRQMSDADVTIVNGLLGFGLPSFVRAGPVVYWISGPVLAAASCDEVRDAPYPILLATSRHLFPEHAAIGGAAVATGFWNASAASATPRRQKASAAHVLISLSTAGVAGMHAWIAFAERAAAAIGCAVTVVDPARRTATRARKGVMLVPPGPHRALLRGACCHVHHGGSATVGETLRAGVPSVVVPQWADQPAFGRRLVSLGLASDVILPGEFTEGRLLAAIHAAAHDTAIAERCLAMSAKLSQEPGLDLAARAVREQLAH